MTVSNMKLLLIYFLVLDSNVSLLVSFTFIVDFCIIFLDLNDIHDINIFHPQIFQIYNLLSHIYVGLVVIDGVTITVIMVTICGFGIRKKERGEKMKGQKGGPPNRFLKRLAAVGVKKKRSGEEKTKMHSGGVTKGTSSTKVDRMMM